MITVMRQQVKKFGFQLIIWLTAISMIIGFLPTFFQRNQSSIPIIVTVNGTPIDYSTFEQRTRQEMERVAFLKQQLGPQAEVFLAAMGYKNPKDMALNGLIQDVLFNDSIYRIGMTIDSKFIMRMLQDPLFVIQRLADIVPTQVLNQQTGEINSHALRQYLSQAGISMAAFETMLIQKFERLALIDLVEQSQYVSTYDVARYAEKMFTKKDYTILKFEHKNYVKKIRPEDVSADELKGYYTAQNQKHKQYWAPETRSAVIWEFSPETYPIKIPDKSIESFYEKHKREQFVKDQTQVTVRRILIAKADGADMHGAEQTAHTIKQEIDQDPTLFSAYAQKHSDDTQTAADGGLMEPFAKGTFDPLFEKAAFQLARDGDISAVVTTDKGFEIVQRVARTPMTFMPLEQVKDEIISQLRYQRFFDRFKYDAHGVLQGGVKNPTLIDEFSQEKKGVKRVIRHAEREGSVEIEKMYRMKPGEIAYSTSDTRAYIIKLDEITQSQAKPFEQATSHVLRDLIDAKGADLLSVDLKQAQEEAATIDFNQLASTYGVEQKRVLEISTEDAEQIKQLEQDQLPIQQMLLLDSQAAVCSLMHNQDGYLVKIAESQNAVSQSGHMDKKSEIIPVLSQEYQDYALRSFIASLQRNATIEHNDL